MQRAAYHIDALAARLIALGVEHIALMGGLAPHIEGWLAPHIEGWLAPQIRQHLVAPRGDALAGALQLAQSARAAAVAGAEP
jgi:N-acetylglucosamine kinase-like BadF-type ATPase